MKTIEIKGSFRPELGKKSSKNIRKSGGVPCVIYGKEKNIHFHADELSFKNLVYTPEAHLVNLILDGQEFRAILKDIQFHPVTDRILHTDFVQILDDKPVVISVPIKVTGISAGVLAGGKLVIKKRNLKIKGSPEYLPEHLTIDISELNIHDSVKVGNLSYDKIELLDPKSQMVLTIATSRVAQKAEEGAAPEAAAPGATSETQEPEEK
jgi:large subunit ribosomal protein L25